MSGNLTEIKFDQYSELGQSLAGRVMESNKVSLTVAKMKELAPTTGAAMAAFARAFFPNSGDDFSPVLAIGRDRILKNLYGPVVANKDGKLVLCAGLQEVEINPTLSGKEYTSPTAIEGVAASYEIEVVEVGGYDRQVMSISLVGKNTIVFYCGIKFAPLKEGEKEATTKQLTALMGKGNLQSVLTDPPVPTLDTHPMKCLLPDHYSVVGYSSFASKKGEAVHTLHLKGKEEDGILTQGYKEKPEDTNILTLDEIAVFADRDMVSILKKEPVISKWFPATLIIRSVNPARNGNGWSVDSSLQLNPDLPEPEAPADIDLSDLEL